MKEAGVNREKPAAKRAAEETARRWKRLRREIEADSGTDRYSIDLYSADIAELPTSADVDDKTASEAVAQLWRWAKQRTETKETLAGVALNATSKKVRRHIAELDEPDIGRSLAINRHIEADEQQTIVDQRRAGWKNLIQPGRQLSHHPPPSRRRQGRCRGNRHPRRSHRRSPQHSPRPRSRTLGP